ncbi:hypothetical protein EDB81DRAFT_906235 [Dactylonectria macrodidyma]|uniref:Orc1-like AAA ATPase domain-containing protein n=1 Tax=Dactylonectria macrodidyma TaxID=307937 RepID=A0A9P9IU58_9HYPO|nr:hypothetical protein EDB81DRAFT_906235 [Dactylonectria macrodidyma]
MREAIPATGLSVVYEPESSTPLVDIVLVHGLKGHPYKTWTSSKFAPAPPKSPGEPAGSCQTSTKGKKSGLRRPISWFKKKSSAKDEENEGSIRALSSKAPSTISEGANPTLFWPADLLPAECPNARILCHGYDTKITKYMSGATNKSSVFSHSKDFLFALSRERVLNRPVIFLAHSLGGIVAKEMLARSSASTDVSLKNVVESTAAVIFLGTPHRGSPELSSLGEWARSILSALRMDTTSAILDTLGLKTTDLERAQEAFSGIWQTYDFRVKTFQEGLGLMGVNLGVLGNKVVPDISSLIGDEREHAETLQANHLEMCRFTSAHDPNYLKVVGELRSMYLSIVSLNTQSVHRNGQIRRDIPGFKTPIVPDVSQNLNNDDFNRLQAACLEYLRFPAMNRRQQMIGIPTIQTCDWLFRHETYRQWLSTDYFGMHGGLLLLKGKPGAGKSTLLKEAVSRSSKEVKRSEYRVASYFFDAKGDRLQRSAVGLLRSILYQLLPHYPEQLQNLSNIVDWHDKEKNGGWDQLEDLELHQANLESFIRTMFSQKLGKRVLIFIDAADECDNARALLYFWRNLTDLTAVTGQLNVCISLRHYPAITVNNCSEITVEQHNRGDISRYVNHKFRLGPAKTESSETWNLLKTTILEKSAGVFLWVVLVMDRVLKKWDEGKSTKFLLKYLDTIPKELETLLGDLVQSLGWEDKQLTTRLFQWAILSTRPLRLHEWHHILAFISSSKPPSSLQQWSNSSNFTETDDQLERTIKNISGGLLEVGSWRFEEPRANEEEIHSVLAGAGSLDSEHGGTRIIQVIHESVREFFLKNNGFVFLNPNLVMNPIGKGHISLMDTLLDYISITELDMLIRARGLRKDNGSSHAAQSKVSDMPNNATPSLAADPGQVRLDAKSFIAPVKKNSAIFALGSSCSSNEHKKSIKGRNPPTYTANKKFSLEDLVKDNGDESAFGDDDDNSSDWEDSIKESEKSSLDRKLFQRVSEPSIVPRRSLITLALEQNDHKPSLNTQASRSPSAVPQTHKYPDDCSPKASLDDMNQNADNQLRQTSFRSNQMDYVEAPAVSPLGPSVVVPGSKTDPQSIKSQAARQGQTNASGFNQLKYSSAPTADAIVNQWIGMSEMADGQHFRESHSPCASSRIPPGSRHSMLLQDHLALLPYATLYLFTHAHMAKATDEDLAPIFNRFQAKDTWSRWVALREDLPQTISFPTYLSIYEGIKWSDTFSADYYKDYDDQGPTTKKRRSSFSVASFSSAGSYK